MFRYDRSAHASGRYPARFSLVSAKTYCEVGALNPWLGWVAQGPVGSANFNAGLQKCAELCRVNADCDHFMLGRPSGRDGNRVGRCHKSVSEKACKAGSKGKPHYLYAGTRSYDTYKLQQGIVEVKMQPYAYYRRLTPLPPATSGFSARRLMVSEPLQLCSPPPPPASPARCLLLASRSLSMPPVPWCPLPAAPSRGLLPRVKTPLALDS